ncbi:putative quinol monooxygenase [Pseudoalteromonas sp. SA25]|uniref:putative quinol monooxygenase n=1 Tax=Pseudoalteromonas sp. SA25 TaxID=2686347 RepID=UPI0013FD9A2F|nr:putative quinol monooxygenase [Pseudoalteromonas sp. SA25]
MTQLTIIANIFANTDKIDTVKSALLLLVEQTQKEPGCVTYTLHQNNQDDAHFVFYENWQNYELWQQHMEAQSIKNYLAKVEGCIASFTINELTTIR